MPGCFLIWQLFAKGVGAGSGRTCSPVSPESTSTPVGWACLLDIASSYVAVACEVHLCFPSPKTVQLTLLSISMFCLRSVPVHPRPQVFSPLGLGFSLFLLAHPTCLCLLVVGATGASLVWFFHCVVPPLLLLERIVPLSPSHRPFGLSRTPVRRHGGIV